MLSNIWVTDSGLCCLMLALTQPLVTQKEVRVNIAQACQTYVGPRTTDLQTRGKILKLIIQATGGWKTWYCMIVFPSFSQDP